MITLSPLYCWRPTQQYRGILLNGLTADRPDLNNRCYISTGATPRTAWALTGVPSETAECYDLYIAHIVDTDEVQVLAYGPHVYEVKVYGNVPKHRVWWVGRRIGEATAEVLDQTSIPGGHP